MSAETIEDGTKGEGADSAPPPMGPPPVVRRAYLRKLKTMRKKYFVLKSDTTEHSARLEYYDSEKKWRSNGAPKRIISLNTCFNINRRLDTKHKHVIALYTNEECFCMVLDGEEELGHWLNAMMLLHHGSEGSDHLYHPRQHIWQVNVQKKGLGASRNILGLYHLCLTDVMVTLVKIKPNTIPLPPLADSCVPDTVQFSLMSIRRCGDSECFFYMELGRSAVTGPGELWMHTDDSNIAQSMHATILHAMSNIPASSKDELRPKSRTRSSSANEASKPMSLLSRRQTYTGTKPPGGLSSSTESSPSVRERCDSLPSRSRLPSDLVPLMAAPSPPCSSLRPYSVCGSGASLLGDSASSHLNEMGWDTTVDEVDGSGVGCTSMGTLAEWSAPHITPRSIPEEEVGTEADVYVPMDMQHTGTPSVGHSRTSSLAGVAEGDTGIGEGYLPMAPVADAGYVDMDRRRNAHALSPAHSSCSVTSGTPSTDIRFLEYPLEKGTSYFTPSEEEQDGRPIRAYSVGSRPDAATGIPYRTEAIVADQARARAVSVGSRSKTRPTATRPPPPVQLHNTHARKSSSAPLLPRAHGSNEPLDDLMELDFSHNKSSHRKQSSTPQGTPEMREIPLHPALPLNILTSVVDKRRTDEYVDMSPGSADVSAYVEMKPSNLSSPIVSSSPLAVPLERRMSLSRSPPVDILATTPEGYAPMAWTAKTIVDNRTDHNRIPSQPITIQANNLKNAKDVERSPWSRLTDSLSLDTSTVTPTKLSSSASPQTPIQFPSSRRNSKKHGRRNSKELLITPSHSHSGIFPFSPNGLASPAKQFAVSTPKPSAERKCQVDASSGTVRLASGESFDDEDDLDDLENSLHYMDITPSGLTTVKEIVEPTVKLNFENRKTMKQLINTAAKADYVNIDGSMRVFKKPMVSRHFSADDALDGDYAVMDPSVVRNRTLDPSRPIAAKSRNITRKMFSPGFPEDEYKESNCFADLEVLPSNPTAVPSLNPVESPHKTRSMNQNNKSAPNAQRPIVVTVTGQIQPTTANFKPINVDETEVRNDSGSPKPFVESALNRRLVAAGKGGRDSPRSRANCCANKSRPSSATSECTESRPASVETTERTVLHYASLDLDGGERSPRPLPLSAGPDTNLAPAFTYSQIDFLKSEEYNTSIPAASTANST